jgi:hypothetical protein
LKAHYDSHWTHFLLWLLASALSEKVSTSVT